MIRRVEQGHCLLLCICYVVQSFCWDWFGVSGFRFSNLNIWNSIFWTLRPYVELTRCRIQSTTKCWVPYPHAHSTSTGLPLWLKNLLICSDPFCLWTPFVAMMSRALLILAVIWRKWSARLAKFRFLKQEFLSGSIFKQEKLPTFIFLG